MPVSISGRLFQGEPLLGYSFVVLLGADVLGFFTECSGVTIEREIKTFPEGGVNDFEHQLPGRIKYTNVTLKRGLAGTKLWDWFQEGLYTGQVERRNVTIILLTANLLDMKTWNLVDVYPAKWTGPGFNTGKNEVSVETLELVCGGSGDMISPDLIQRMPADQENLKTVGTNQKIDVPALADKVYALLKQELRVERERLGWNR